MSGHGHDAGGHDHHAEDSTVPMKVGIFLVCTFIIIAVISHFGG